MDIRKATASYEAWVAGQMRLIREDLDRKHAAMASDRFAFFRATFYRWTQLWPKDCPKLASAPPVLAVGDLHVENFGLWRDREGRLVWGINDFDEAFPAAYTVDLVRLATSALMAADDARIPLDGPAIEQAILDGYRKSLWGDAKPFVLGERHQWLRALALPKLKEPVGFWDKLAGFAPAKGPVLRETAPLLEAALPKPYTDIKFVHRIAGLGSLGRDRVVATSEWLGGLVAREAKALSPSAWCWTDPERPPAGARLHYPEILEKSVRCPDPFVSLEGGWLIRRLAPDGSRLELAEMPSERDHARLLAAMGSETANVHLGSRAAISSVRAHLDRLPKRWLLDAATTMRDAVADDWKTWKAG